MNQRAVQQSFEPISFLERPVEASVFYAFSEEKKNDFTT